MMIKTKFSFGMLKIAGYGWKTALLHRFVMLVLLIMSGLSLVVLAATDIRLPAIIADNMVLQQERPLPIWGWAKSDDKITLDFAGQTRSATADENGRWQVTFNPLTASNKGRNLLIRSKTSQNIIKVKNVLVGEVWICSGQSNMQMSVSCSMKAEQEVAKANHPQIRLFTVPNLTASVPVETCGGSWQVCTPTTVPGFSAVGYFFGRYLHQKLKVPVGLINTSWGGTIAEAWTSASTLRVKLPEFIPQLEQLITVNKKLSNLITNYKKELLGYRESLQKLYALEDNLVAAGAWAAVELDDRTWKTMTVPANWETIADFKNVDGIVWLRKDVELPESWAGKELWLRPGPVDEVDQTWFNGKRVGGRGNMRRRNVRFWNVPRKYRIPGKLVKAGRNVIAIRVFDTIGQGGLWGAPAATMVLELAKGEKVLKGGELTQKPLAGEWRCRAEYILPLRPVNPSRPNCPGVLFNSMINPLIPFAIRGATWYQGESNARRAVQYRTLLPALIGDWRARWNCGDFPFLVVQLANFMERRKNPGKSNWAELREAQAMTAANDPNVGLAVIIDIGEAKNVHPKNKQDVGLRLGLAARAIAYKQKIPYQGPTYRSLSIKDSKVELYFVHIDGGLVARGETLQGFSIRGKGGAFVWAKAKIKGKQVVVWSLKVANPVAVRYAWANNPDCNLYNGVGLPAVPFRTDAP